MHFLETLVKGVAMTEESHFSLFIDACFVTLLNLSPPFMYVFFCSIVSLTPFCEGFLCDDGGSQTGTLQVL